MSNPALAVRSTHPADVMPVLAERYKDTPTTTLIESLDTLVVPGRVPADTDGLVIRWLLDLLSDRLPEHEDAIDAWVGESPDDVGIEQAELARATVRIYREAGVQ